MNVERFPIYRYDKIFNKFSGNLINETKLIYKDIKISYPCRLDAMAINPSAVCYNDEMVFTPGEVVISTKKYINVFIKVIDKKNTIVCGKDTKRKVLVKHAYSLMKKVLKFHEGLEINVIDNEIPKHCGFGSSSSTIAAVAAAINEMFNHPINNKDLIKYLASNHGEEISDDNENELKMVQCIGGGATNGLTEEGIIIIAGKSTPICSMKYDGDIVIGIPKKFKIKDAKYLMEKEEENLWKFKETGDRYSKDIAYKLLHRALPGMINNSIKELADVVFDYRFNMGSIENCSFVYKPMIKEGKILRKLYENGKCELLSLSSVGPAYFAIVKNKKQKAECIKEFENVGMNVIETSICNDIYTIDYKTGVDDIYWNNKNTAKSFAERPCSEYITNELDKLMKKNIKFIDIGCGGGRYSRYINEKGMSITALDKYPNMATSIIEDNIPFIQGCIDNLPLEDKKFDVVLSIGVIHNATTIEEYEKAISEMYRILKNNGKIVFSVFTNDVITSDLTYVENSKYEINGRQPMILLSKNEINNILNKYGFKIIKNVDEHITDVGSGKRNVYTVLLEKSIY